MSLTKSKWLGASLLFLTALARPEGADLFTRIDSAETHFWPSFLQEFDRLAAQQTQPKVHQYPKPESALLSEAQTEKFERMVGEGCFYCSSARLIIAQVDYDHDHCVDLCAQDSQQSLFDAEEWNQTMSGRVENEDEKCAQIIQSALSQQIQTGYLAPQDIIDFAEGLVYDERIDTCFAYDPRDAMRRRLQSNGENLDCTSMNCFDCAYTAGECMWDYNNRECLRPEGREKIQGLRWWQWFEYCEDELGMCQSNLGTISKISGQDAASALADDKDLSFSITRPTQYNAIPRNYYCRWEVSIEVEAEYQLSIKRNFYPIREQLELNIIGDSKQQQVRDIELASTSPDIEWERYALVNTAALQIFARNKDTTTQLQTFQITLKETFSEEEATALQQLTLLLMMILLGCLCMACCTVMLRLRCKFRRRVNDIDNYIDRDGNQLDEETRNRNRRLEEMRRAQMNGQGGGDEGDALRRVAHLSLVDRYSRLIPVIKYKKNTKEIDEFNTTECVICMEAFTNGTKIRKIPSCRHIFHDECLMKWLSGSQSLEAQKCPMCNSDITVEILEKAIEEESNAKKGSIFGRLSKSSPARQQRVNMPLPNSSSASQLPSNNAGDLRLRDIDSLRSSQDGGQAGPAVPREFGNSQGRSANNRVRVQVAQPDAQYRSSNHRTRETESSFARLNPQARNNLEVVMQEQSSSMQSVDIFGQSTQNQSQSRRRDGRSRDR